MKQEKTELSQESLTPRELSQRADEILARAGYDIFGRRDSGYLQEDSSCECKLALTVPKGIDTSERRYD